MALLWSIEVPIGLITTAFGASTAEAWISKPALEANPKFTALLSSFNENLERYEVDTAAQVKYKTAYEKWKIEAAKAKAEGKNEIRSPKNPTLNLISIIHMFCGMGW